MFKELLSIFTGDNPLSEISEAFTEMLQITQDMTLEASAIFWQTNPPMDRIKTLYERDVQVNKLERAIRKKVATHLTVNPGRDVPYCLLMMSLVKDVERLGDYAKNLAETTELAEQPIPEDELTGALRDIRDGIENMAREAARVFADSDRERATNLTHEGRSMTKRCDEVVRHIARADYPTALAVKLTLGARYYKRIAAHMLNLISSVIMPLHKLDYYDEDFIEDKKKRS